MTDHKENLSALLENALANTAERSSLAVEKLGKEKHVDDLCAHFIWKDGQQSVFLCPNAVEKGAVFSTVEEALQTHPELAEKLETLTKNDAADAWSEQLAPLTGEGIVLFIPRKMCQKREFLLDLELSDPARAALMKVFVLIEDDASAVVTLNLHSRGINNTNLFAGQFYCCVGRNARLVLNEVQDFGTQTVSVRRKQTVVEDGGDLRWNICELGGAESHDSLDVRMEGENSSAIVYGLYFPVKNQQMYIETRQDHLVPRTYSNLHYKGALADRAKASWEGMIYVDPKADKTDGYQKNENLMLSDEAEIFAKPGLEIIMDDVKCSHGTTITNIDDDQIFYLTSRGIPEREAEKLVIRGFFDTILNLITYSPIRGKLQSKIDSKMQEGD
ncbi:MAG: Fe-S cluster assembly protein SufD [Anaerolineaceae bacterium]|nr:Fe-S cluster assembly protein SufD [Anaerolineaceae bacterium]